MMFIDTMLKLREHDMGITIDELVRQIVQAESKDERRTLYQKYVTLDRQRRLFREGIAVGWEDFDWEQAHQLGWLCVADYSRFPQLEHLRAAVESEHAARVAEQMVNAESKPATAAPN